MYPPLGALISYIRFDKDSQIERGHGVVRGYGLDHGNRAVAIIGLDDTKQISVFLPCIDADEDFCARFVDTFKRVEAVADAARVQQQEIVTKANTAIDAAWDELLGAPIAVPTISQGGEA